MSFNLSDPTADTDSLDPYNAHAAGGLGLSDLRRDFAHASQSLVISHAQDRFSGFYLAGVYFSLAPFTRDLHHLCRSRRSGYPPGADGRVSRDEKLFRRTAKTLVLFWEINIISVCDWDIADAHYLELWRFRHLFDVQRTLFGDALLASCSFTATSLALLCDLATLLEHLLWHAKECALSREEEETAARHSENDQRARLGHDDWGALDEEPLSQSPRGSL